MLGRFSFWKCVSESVYMRCMPPMVWWWRGMNNWLGEKIERAAGGGRGGGQGVPERSWESSVTSLHTHLKLRKYSHLQSMVLHYCTLSVTLCGPLFSSVIYILSYCVFWLLWMFQCSFVPTLSGPFVFVRPCQNAATLCCFSSALFSFSGDRFLWQTELFDFAHFS